MAALVLVFVLIMVSPGISQLSNNSTNTYNTPIRTYCSGNPASSSSSFFSNRNSTFAALRRQLSGDGLYYATARNMRNENLVYGVAQCRKYLSRAQCVACFDVGVSALSPCNSVNGGSVHLDNCFLKYQNYDENYDLSAIIQDVGMTAVGLCGDQLATQATSFNETVERLLSDIRVATPRTSDYYVASTRQVSNDDRRVLYAIAQCVQNTSQTICQTCLNTVSNYLRNCLPIIEGKSIDMWCFMRYSQTPFFQDNQTTNITPFLILTEGSSSKVGIIAGVSGAISLFLLIISLSLWYRYRLWKKSKQAGEEASELQGAANYKYKDLQSATDNFSEKYRLGKGGFGEVFKAILDDKTVVAVKKLQVENARAKLEFDNEVMLISSVRHRNLTRLLGWSNEGPELLLVLEYMPLGSLDRFLWGEKKGTLNWKQRFDIILGTAKGLAHLHDEFHVKIIHRDIKPSNILLDDDFQPKIADFGLARFQPEDQTHVSTNFAGTLGYTAPEYAKLGKLSEKVDTYSLGIVILEIISGKKCVDMNSTDGSNTDFLLERAWKLYEKGLHMNLIDETLDINENEEQHRMKIIEIALMCTQSSSTSRPTMSEIVLLLSGGQSMEAIRLTRPTFINTNRRIHIGRK